MSPTRHLPIWKAVFDLAHLEHAERRFSRYHTPPGHWLRQTTQRLYRLLARANDARDAAGVLALDERRLIRPPSGAPSFLSAVRTVR
jgi:hypothetical protein